MGATPALVVWDAEGNLAGEVVASLSNTAAAGLAQYVQGELQIDDPDNPLTYALRRYTVARTVSMLTHPDELADLLNQRVELTVTSYDLSPLLRRVNMKRCHYQEHAGRDLYCSAAGDHDDTAVGQRDLAKLARTTEPVCRACSLPDTEYLCSRLAHPQVVGVPSFGGYERNVVSAMCEAGRPEISDPAGCRPGGHACWERVVDPRPTQPAGAFLLVGSGGPRRARLDMAAGVRTQASAACVEDGD